MKRSLILGLSFLVILTLPTILYAEDTTPPDTTITSGPSGEIDYRDVTFEWTGSDDVTATKDLIYSYKLEGEDDSWSNWSYDTNKSYSLRINDDYTFKVKAKDNAGNVDSTPTTRAFKLQSNEPGVAKWMFDTGAKVDSSPAIGPDGTIYVGSYYGNFYALNPDGTEQWVFSKLERIYSSPTIGPDGTIYLGERMGDGKLYAVNPDGTEKWSFGEGGMYSSPAIGPDGTIYAAFRDGYLYAIRPNGTEKWSLRTDSYSFHFIDPSPVIGSDGTIYIGSKEDKLYAINPDGTKKWTFDSAGALSSPAIGPDGTIYFGSGDGLYAIRPDGTDKWSLTIGDGISYSSPAIGPDRNIYVGGEDGKLYAVNPDGTEKWSFQTGLWVQTAPAIGSDGTVYLGGRDDNLYALIGESEGLAGSHWPMFQYDPQHTGNVADINIKPTAQFKSSPDEPNPDQTITFDASSSSDSNGTITEYKWDWDDDGIFEDDVSSPTIEHSFSSTGDYPVTLEVIDDDGASDTITKTVTVGGAVAETTLPLGWNLFSPQGKPTNPDPAKSLGDDLEPLKLYYDYSLPEGYTIYPADTESTNLDWRQGYWIYVNSETPVGMDTNVPTGEQTIELTNTGWHLIGLPYNVDWSQASFSDPSDFQTDGADNVRIVSWSPADETYYNHYSGDSYVLSSWDGFWVKVENTPASITVNETSSSASSISEKTPLPQSVDPDELDYPPKPPTYNDSGKSLEVLAYPNLVDGTQKVLFRVIGPTEEVEGMRTEVFNPDGSSVWEGQAQGRTLTWKPKGLANGIYLYKTSVKINGRWKNLGMATLLVIE